MPVLAFTALVSAELRLLNADPRPCYAQARFYMLASLVVYFASVAAAVGTFIYRRFRARVSDEKKNQ